MLIEKRPRCRDYASKSFIPLHLLASCPCGAQRTGGLPGGDIRRFLPRTIFLRVICVYSVHCCMAEYCKFALQDYQIR